MKVYQHIKAKCIALPDNGERYYVPELVAFLPKAIIENSNEWKLYDDENPSYTNKEIQIVLRTFLGKLSINRRSFTNLEMLRCEKVFFQLLLDQKK